MADIFTREKRSEVMSRVRSKDSKLEVEFRKCLWKAGYRYRKNSTKHYGKPDLVLTKYRIVVFIDSCFWHGCKRHGTIPKTRSKFWTKKISRNIERDRAVTRYYENKDWILIRCWEHEINTIEKIDDATEKLIKTIICANKPLK